MEMIDRAMDPTQYPSDEKNVLLQKDIQPHEPALARRSRSQAAKTLAFLALLFIWSLYYFTPTGVLNSKHKGCADKKTGSLEDGFDTIVPSEKLEWHSCYGALKCARLTVPMDYHRPLNASKDNPKVHIGLVLVPGTGKVSKSPLLLNPGGPGGSGVAFAAGAGFSIQKFVGIDQDIVGFDPRGIGFTTPNADCFSYPENLDKPSYDDEDYIRGEFHRVIWALTGSEIGIVNSSSVALQKLDNRARGVAQLCKTKDGLYGEDSILKYVNTPNVARDMLSIIDAWDEWRDTLDDESVASDEPVDVEQQKSYSNDNGDSYSLDTKGKLVYWGFSYGTLLGATFASMFPDRVGRVVLDGVVDADGYVEPIWAESLWDADKVWDSLPKYCHDAKNLCALYRDGDEVKDIAARIEEVFTSIQKQPLTWVDQTAKMPLSITYSTLRLIMFVGLYSPTGGFSISAVILNLFYEGYFDVLSQIFGYRQNFDGCMFCGKNFPSMALPKEALIAIMCSDKRYKLNETVPNLEKRFEEMSNLSKWSDVWMSVMIGCDGYDIEIKDPPMRWDDHPAHKQKPINTSYPLLFLSNTYDPVTPLRASLKMAKKFTDAGLIEQKSEGHCTLSAASKCTISKVRAYFAEGKVPPPPSFDGTELDDGKWVKCEADEWPFHPARVASQPRSEEAMAEMETLNALKEVQEVFSKMRFWGVTGLDPQVENFLAVFEGL